MKLDTSKSCAALNTDILISATENDINLFNAKLKDLQLFARISKQYRLDINKSIAVDIIKCYFSECFIRNQKVLKAKVFEAIDFLKSDYLKYKDKIISFRLNRSGSKSITLHLVRNRIIVNITRGDNGNAYNIVLRDNDIFK